MKRLQHFFLLAATLLCFNSAVAQYTENDILLYIDTYKELAINKMYEYKIPASITIAQGIFESACGTSHLAVDGNNHFGIKCHTGWTGDTILIDDDALQECFRKYQTVEESYTDHSLFLKNRNRYASLFTLNIMDYPGWARGLKAAGYATNPQYADRLINIIQKYNIARLDTFYQERLNSGYFNNYPDVHPELLAEEPFAKLPTLDIQPKPHAVAKAPEIEKEQTKAPEKTDKLNRPNLKDKAKKAKSKKQPDSNGKTQEQQPSSQSQQDKNKQETSKIQPNQQTQKQESVTQNKPTETPASTPKEKTVEHNSTTQAPAHSTYQTNNNDNSKVTRQPANAATEQAEPEELPTKITVFATTDGRYPTVNDYPFTERTVYQNNKVLFVIAQKGDTYQIIAKEVQSTEKKLKKYNDAPASAKLKVGQVVYIENKRKVGEQNTYTIQNSESPLYIAQKVGMQLKQLCKLNKIEPKTELKKGKTLKLR